MVETHPETNPVTEAQSILNLEHHAQGDKSGGVVAADSFRNEISAVNKLSADEISKVYKQLAQSPDSANFKMVKESDGKQYIQFEDVLPGEAKHNGIDNAEVKKLGEEISKAFKNAAEGKEPGLNDPQLREDISKAYKEALLYGPEAAARLTNAINRAIPGDDTGIKYTPDQSGFGGKLQFVHKDANPQNNAHESYKPVSDAIDIKPASSQQADADGIAQAIKAGGPDIGKNVAKFVQHQVDAAGGGGPEGFQRMQAVLDLAKAELKKIGYELNTDQLNLGGLSVTGPDGKTKEIDINKDLKLTKHFGVRGL